MTNGSLAQSVERRPVKAMVGSSSLSGSAIWSYSIAGLMRWPVTSEIAGSSPARIAFKDLSATFYLLREHEVRGSSPRLGTYAQLAQLAERVNAGLVLCPGGELVNTAD